MVPFLTAVEGWRVSLDSGAKEGERARCKRTSEIEGDTERSTKFIVTSVSFTD